MCVCVCVCVRDSARAPFTLVGLSEDPRASRRVFFLGTCSTLAQGHRACVVVVVVVVVDGPPEEWDRKSNVKVKPPELLFRQSG